MIIPVGFVFKENNMHGFLCELKKTYPKNLPPFDVKYVDLLLNPDSWISHLFDTELKHRMPIYIDFRVESESNIDTLSRYFVEKLSNKKIGFQIFINELKISESEIKHALTEEYERVVKKPKKVLPKLYERRSIPYKKLPEGIIISFSNSLRLLEDAIILAEFKRFRNAIINAILANEEFAKTLIFLRHFYNQEDITKEQVKNIFQSHWYRLAELASLLDQVRYGMEPNSSQYMMNSALAEDYQWTKERYLYTDWINSWIDPQEQFSIKRNYPGFEGDDEKAFLMEFLDFAQPLHSVLKDFFFSREFEEIQNYD